MKASNYLTLSGTTSFVSTKGPRDSALYRMAVYFATTEHVTKRGKMYGFLPYTHHLMQVAEVLQEFVYPDPSLLAAAVLHDIVEDCPPISARDLAEMFNAEVAAYVAAVTDPPGNTRKARKKGEAERILATPNALLIKLADRISNVRNGGPHFSMYKEEYAKFRKALIASDAAVTPSYQDGEQSMWLTLDNLLNYYG